MGIFLFISTVGRVPGTLMACLQGGKAFDHQYKTLLILLGISILIILLFYIYHDEIHRAIKKIRRQESKPLDGQEGQGS
jgi:membrane protein DedA with SNARE-associated domain